MDLNKYIGNVKNSPVTVIQNAETFDSLREVLDLTYSNIEAVTFTVSDSDRVTLVENDGKDVEVTVLDFYTSSKGSLWNKALAYKQKGATYLAYASQFATYKTKFNLQYLAKSDAQHLILPVPFDGRVRPAPYKYCFIGIKGSVNKVIVRQDIVKFTGEEQKAREGFTPLKDRKSVV